MIVFIAGRGTARRIETIASVAGLDPDRRYAVVDLTPTPIIATVSLELRGARCPLASTPVLTAINPAKSAKEKKEVSA